MRVTSIASSGCSGGRIDGSRRAIIVLPVPGGPCRKRLCPPAAATSRPGTSALWPRTSARSASSSPTSGSSDGMPGGMASPRIVATRSTSDSMPMISMSGISEASRARESGRISRRRPCPRTASATASAPRTGRVSPVSESSPTIAHDSTVSGSSCPEATSSATASGRSNAGPTLRRYAGARLTVMRRSGNSKPEFCSAERTRSRASRTALSARPTTVNAGRPTRMSASTQTRCALTPSTEKVETRASIRTRPPGGRGGRVGRAGRAGSPRRRSAGCG